MPSDTSSSAHPAHTNDGRPTAGEAGARRYLDGADPEELFRLAFAWRRAGFPPNPAWTIAAMRDVLLARPADLYVAGALALLSRGLSSAGRHHEALRATGKALRIEQRIPDAAVRCAAHLAHAVASLGLQRWATAARSCDTALAEYRENPQVGDGLTAILLVRAAARCGMGRYERAIPDLQEARRELGRTGDEQEIGGVLELLADALERSGDAEAALLELEAARQAHLHAGSPVRALACLARISSLRAGQGAEDERAESSEPGI